MQNGNQFASVLLTWYDQEKRDLPWRKNHDPYRIWLSEIMLQQTRVEAAIAYYERFLTAYPTIFDLANTSEEVLFKLWEGLGYYQRARNLLKTAQFVVKQYQGVFPSGITKLQDLPGIGEYTAGAIASIAFGSRVPAIDGNVCRVFSRLYGIEDNLSSSKGKHKIRSLVEEVLPYDRVGDFNQALMELGAKICLPNGEPLCALCPMQQQCKAFEWSRPLDFPVKGKKKEQRIDPKTMLLFHTDHQIAVEKRPSLGLLAGMWQFPNLEGHYDVKAIQDYLKEQGIAYTAITSLESKRYEFTHRVWSMIGYSISVPSAQEVLPYQFVNAEVLNTNYAMASVFKTYFKVANALILPQECKE